jgi:hypothetical protein
MKVSDDRSSRSNEQAQVEQQATKVGSDGLLKKRADAAPLRFLNLRNMVKKMHLFLQRTQEGKMRNNVSTLALDHSTTAHNVAGKIIQYTLSQRDLINLSVYNLKGQLISTLVEGQQDPGSHSIPFSVAGLPSGKYLYILRVGDRYHSNVMTVH